MYLPRSLASQLYLALLSSCTPASPPVLILPSASDPDALCATRILTALLKRDFIPHKIHPVGGYSDLRHAGQTLIQPMKYSQGGSGGVVICLGVGGLVDLGEVLGFDGYEVEEEMNNDYGGVEVWVFDKRRPWNLGNVFGGVPRKEDARPMAGVQHGRIGKSYRSGKGGIIVFDDGDIEEELETEKGAFFALAEMPEIEDEDSDSDESDLGDSDPSGSQSKKRKASRSNLDEDGSDDEDGRPRQRRRSNSGSSMSLPPRSGQETSRDGSESPVPQSPTPKQPSAKALRTRLLNLKRGHEETLSTYYNLGTSYSEPVSSLLYSLASELGREDNDLLWLAVVGVTSLELSGHIPSDLHNASSNRSHHQSWQVTRHKQIQALFRDEVRRLNPPSASSSNSPTEYSSKSSPTDSSIRLSPEPHLSLLRHWSLYESMLHSSFLSSRLHTWNDSGKKRLHKLLAKMGVSLQQCRQVWTHMDVALKNTLRDKLLSYAGLYGIEGIVPDSSKTISQEGWGFVKSWGWKASLSATDVVLLVGAILDVGPHHAIPSTHSNEAVASSQRSTAALTDADAAKTTYNFFPAYDALAPNHPTLLLSSLPLAQHLSRAILRTGTSLLSKNQMRHLRSFRMAVVKDGPDLDLFAGSVGALIKLAGWLDQALRAAGKGGYGKDDVPLVVAALDTGKDSYVVVGLGAGSSSYLHTHGDSDAKRKAKEDKKKKKDEEREKKRKEKEERKEIERRARALDHDPDDSDDETESEPSDSDSDSDSDASSPPTSPSSSSQTGHKAPTIDRKKMGNRFGHAFQEVSQNTNADVKVDHFDHCVVEVKKEELGTFLEALSMACVVG